MGLLQALGHYTSLSLSHLGLQPVIYGHFFALAVLRSGSQAGSQLALGGIRANLPSSGDMMSHYK
jgi:hypothetical protein